MNQNTIDLLERIDSALTRMRIDGAEKEGCKYYQRLKAKRDAIASGEQYRVKTFSPASLIAYIGAHIPNINTNYKGEIIKNSQDKKVKTIESLQGFGIETDHDTMKQFETIDNIFSCIPNMINKL